VAVAPPSVEILKQRLTKRGTETEKTLETRLKNAPGELDQMFQLRDTFQFRVVNNDLELASKTFSSVV
jgi:guanylate kinase